MVASVYQDPDLVAVYDAVHPPGLEAEFFVALAGRRPSRILDVGCGTGRLAVRLAEAGHLVTGLEPSETMLVHARDRPGAERGTWICGDAAALAQAARFDLMIMAGHVFQVFCDDHQARGALKSLAAHLAADGRVAFANRNPGMRKWEHWTETESRERCDSPVLGRCTVHWEILAVDGPLVSYATVLQLPDGRTRRGQDTICFRDCRDIGRLLDDVGLAAQSWYGDWDERPLGAQQPEIIAIAHAGQRAARR